MIRELFKSIKRVIDRERREEAGSQVIQYKDMHAFFPLFSSAE